MRPPSPVDSLPFMFRGAPIVVAEIVSDPPQMANADPSNGSIAAMLAMKPSAGRQVAAVDLNRGLNLSAILSSDGAHPDQTGHDGRGGTECTADGSLVPAK